MLICGIYKITNPNNKIYIGQSIDILNRWSNYKSLHCKNQIYLHRSLKKYGVHKHKFEVICQCDELELNNLEKYYIDLFQCFNNKFGLNLREGGYGGGRLSLETKERMSKAQKGHFVSQETRRKMSIFNKGKVLSFETREKMRKTRKGKLKSDEHKIKLSKSLMGHNVSDDIKKAMSVKHKGVKLTEKHKQNISKSLKGKKTFNSIKIIDTKNNTIYESINDAHKSTNINYRKLSNMLSGKCKNTTTLRYYKSNT